MHSICRLLKYGVFSIGAVLAASGCGDADAKCGAGDTCEAGEHDAVDSVSTGSAGQGAGNELGPSTSQGNSNGSTGTGGSGSFADQGSASAAIPGSDDAGVDSQPPAPSAPELAANPFVITAHDPFSTFAADVDTASYDIFRRDVQNGGLPWAGSVRLEDFVNYFEYDYPAPADGAPHPFAISLAAAPHPFGGATTLVRVGIQAQKPDLTKKPAHVVFLIDSSGSMQSPEKLPVVQRLVRQALDELDPTDKVSIVTYAGDTVVRLEPTAVSERDAIVAVIDGLNAAGSTNGASGIQLAYEQAQAGFVKDGINHVVLCTDGDFNVGISSDDELVELIEAKRKTGVTLTALGFGETNNDSMMEKVSNAGNGMYSVITSQAQADRYAAERLLATIEHIAKDMKLQVEWNPEHVHAYRLLGYENRAIADDDFRDDQVDAGEVGAGHRVTALYEVVLAGETLPSLPESPAVDDGEPVAGTREIAASDLVLVKVRYKRPGESETAAAREVAESLAPSAIATSAAIAGEDFEWAAAIANFAEQLKQSPYVTKSQLDALAEVFKAQASRDLDREEFLPLFEKARAQLK